ncbi:MAG: hypothetical protein ACI85K_003107 [Hyphomicrobiaceae bacterium]
MHGGSGDAEVKYGLDADTWTFDSTAAPAFGSNPAAAAIGDLNGDGFDDLVIANQGSDDVSVTLGVSAPLA